MPKLHVISLAIGIASCAVLVLPFTPASASTSGIIYNNENPLACVNDPGDSTTVGTELVLTTSACGSAGTEWVATADSYGSEFSSIVLANTSHGDLCIDNPGNGGDGTQLEIKGCNGSEEQAWYDRGGLNSVGDPVVALANPDGETVDLYGNHQVTGTAIVAWHFENPVPPAEIWNGPPNVASN